MRCGVIARDGRVRAASADFAGNFDNGADGGLVTHFGGASKAKGFAHPSFVQGSE